ncbi:MAG: VWA domain-containing protein [Blastocatellia bacterium]|nr:VWA domain-containing protein [Blastocatellia bacterium]
MRLKISALVMAFCLSINLAAVSVSGQTKRPRRVTEDPQQKPAKPAPTPTPKPTAAPETKPATTTETQPPLTPPQSVGVQPAAAGDPAAAQPGQDPKKPTAPEPEAEPIRINSNLVVVPVSVTDAYGNPIRDLKAEDFEMEEDSVTQQIQTLGEPGKTPIDLSLLFDVSRSIRNRFDFEREAAGRFLRVVMKPGDGVSVFSIGTGPKLSIPRTTDVEAAIAATAAIQPTDESTAFFDTVVKAARYMSDNATPGTRRVMVILSDGEDTNSERFRLGDAQRDLQRSDCLFYAINPSGPSIRLNKISTKGHEGMVRLAGDTGGLAFLPDKIEDLTQVFNQIAAELQAQYLLGYYSTNETNDGKFRKIGVRVPKRADLRIRSRQGYYAPKD